MRKQRTRKMTAAFCAALLLGAAADPAYAGEEQSMQLTMTKDAKYLMTIPKDQTTVAFGSVRTKIGTLAVTGDIGTKQQVRVTAEKTDFVDVRDAKNSFAFALQNDGKDFSQAIWSSEQVRAEEPTAHLLEVYIPTETWAQTQAGRYQATLTFKAELEDIR